MSYAALPYAFSKNDNYYLNNSNIIKTGDGYIFEISNIEEA